MADAKPFHWEFTPEVPPPEAFRIEGGRPLRGTVPVSGVLQVGLPFPALPAGVGAQNRFMQAFVRTPSGQTRLGSPATLTILDSIY